MMTFLENSFIDRQGGLWGLLVCHVPLFHFRTHFLTYFVLQLNKYGFEKTSRPWVAILDYLYIKWLINKRFSTLTSLTQKNRWTWKVKNLNKFDLECKQVRQVVILRILKQFSRFDEFCYCFCTTPATVDRQEGCVTCLNHIGNILWNKAVVVFWREKLQWEKYSSRIILWSVNKIWWQEKLHFQMVSSGRVLPFWCCLRCCSGTHKDVAGGQKLETQFSRASALLSHVLLRSRR